MKKRNLLPLILLLISTTLHSQQISLTAEQIIEQIRKKTGVSWAGQTVDVFKTGDPDMKVSKIAFVPGAPGSEMQMAALAREDVEVVLIGESREWETVEYDRDATEQGRQKAMIILGHVPSEEAGMEECARWLKTFLSDVPVTYLQTPEPFWVLL